MAKKSELPEITSDPQTLTHQQLVKAAAQAENDAMAQAAELRKKTADAQSADAQSADAQSADAQSETVSAQADSEE